MERKVGEMFKYAGRRYLVEESGLFDCANCAARFLGSRPPHLSCEVVGNCCPYLRKDGKYISVISIN